MKEQTIEKHLVRVVHEFRGECIKQTGIGGVPDRLVLLPGGRAVFVELKAPGKKPTELQSEMMRKLRDLGFRCEVIDSKEQFNRIFREGSHEV